MYKSAAVLFLNGGGPAADLSLCRVYKRLLVRKTEITAAQRGAEEGQWKDEDTKIPLRGNRR